MKGAEGTEDVRRVFGVCISSDLERRVWSFGLGVLMDWRHMLSSS